MIYLNKDNITIRNETIIILMIDINTFLNSFLSPWEDCFTGFRLCLDYVHVL